MIRLLVIGRKAADVGAALLELAPEMTIDTARLPAAGIRQLAQTPPDAVIVEGSDGERATAIVEALRAQPLGALTPVVVLGDGIDPTLEIEARLRANEGASEILRALEDALELELGELTAGAGAVVTMETTREPKPANLGQPTQPTPPPTASFSTRPDEPRRTDREETPARVETPKFLLEEIVENEDEGGPRPVDRSEIFGPRTRSAGHEEVAEQSVKRMLRAVRHEDYYTILGVHRGAETAAIRDAYYHQLERFDPQKVEITIAHRFHDALEEIRDALEDAWAVLGDTALRESYLEATTRTSG